MRVILVPDLDPTRLPIMNRINDSPRVRVRLPNYNDKFQQYNVLTQTSDCSSSTLLNESDDGSTHHSNEITPQRFNGNNHRNIGNHFSPENNTCNYYSSNHTVPNQSVGASSESTASDVVITEPKEPLHTINLNKDSSVQITGINNHNLVDRQIQQKTSKAKSKNRKRSFQVFTSFFYYVDNFGKYLLKHIYRK